MDEIENKIYEVRGQKVIEELRKRIEYLEEDVRSDRESYERQFDELFSAFAKVSTINSIENHSAGKEKSGRVRYPEKSFGQS